MGIIDTDSASRASTTAPPSRRRFLETMTRGLSGAALASATAPLTGWTTPRPSPTLGVALVGLGNYATGQLGPALQETSLCELTGIVTGTPAKAERWTRKYDLPNSNVYDYESFDRIADNSDIDIVYVVLPNAMHAEYTIRAAEAGKHVICEKPMAISVSECRSMIEACDRHDRKLSIGYRLHFEPHHRRVMTLGQDKVYGPVTAMQNGFGYHLPDSATDAPHIQWRLEKEMAGGGALMDLGIYAIQAGRYVTGEEPSTVSAQEFKTRPDIFDEVDETIFFQLKFPGGTVLNGSTSYNANFNRLYASATDGWFEVEPAYSYGGLEGRTSEGPMDRSNVNQQARQMDAFARCILEDRPSRVPGQEGLRDLQVIEAIYESIAAGGREVEVASTE